MKTLEIPGDHIEEAKLAMSKFALATNEMTGMLQPGFRRLFPLAVRTVLTPNFAVDTATLANPISLLSAKGARASSPEDRDALAGQLWGVHCRELFEKTGLLYNMAGPAYTFIVHPHPEEKEGTVRTNHPNTRLARSVAAICWLFAGNQKEAERLFFKLYTPDGNIIGAALAIAKALDTQFASSPQSRQRTSYEPISAWAEETLRNEADPREVTSAANRAFAAIASSYPFSTILQSRASSLVAEGLIDLRPALPSPAPVKLMVVAQAEHERLAAEEGERQRRQAWINEMRPDLTIGGSIPLPDVYARGLRDDVLSHITFADHSPVMARIKEDSEIYSAVPSVLKQLGLIIEYAVKYKRTIGFPLRLVGDVKTFRAAFLGMQIKTPETPTRQFDLDRTIGAFLGTVLLRIHDPEAAVIIPAHLESVLLAAFNNDHELVTNALIPEHSPGADLISTLYSLVPSEAKEGFYEKSEALREKYRNPPSSSAPRSTQSSDPSFILPT